VEVDIPSLVKAIRQARDLTQEQLARELGVTFSTVNAWENGRHRPIPVLLAALERLAAARGSGGPARRGAAVARGRGVRWKR
jgi:transcriptional regulator with XRE-family HTH domain